MQTQWQLDKAARDQIEAALPILKKPGSFVRRTASVKFPFEAILPGNWTKFESAGFNERAFEIMSKEDGLKPIEGKVNRWAIR